MIAQPSLAQPQRGGDEPEVRRQAIAIRIWAEPRSAWQTYVVSS